MPATVMIIGNLGGDPEERQTPNGKAVVEFSVAVNLGKDKDPNWYRVSVFGKSQEYCKNYLTKGAKVAVTGDLKMNESNGKSYLNVVAYSVQGLDKKQEEEFPF